MKALIKSLTLKWNKSRKNRKRILAILKSMEIASMSNLINFPRKALTFPSAANRILIIILVMLSKDQILNIIIGNQIWRLDYNKVEWKTKFSYQMGKLKQKHKNKKRAQTKNNWFKRKKTLDLLAPLCCCNKRFESCLQNLYPLI